MDENINTINENMRSEDKKILKETQKNIDKLNNEGYSLSLSSQEPKNRAKFSQIIKENLQTLFKKYPDYISNAEFALLFKLSSLTCKVYNKLTEFENRTGYGYKSTAQEATVRYIADFINENRSTVSNKINNLIKKGFILEDEKTKKSRTTSKRALYINPEISYTGDRNAIPGELVRKIIKNDKLEQNDICLPWKVWINANENYGKLIRRETYIQKRMNRK